MKNFAVTKDGKEYWVSRSMAAVSYVYSIIQGTPCVLANKRGPGLPNNVGKWNAPSGFLDYDETLMECAIRETYEETGVKIDSTTMMEVDDSTARASQNVLVRFATLIDYQEPNIDHCEPNEVDDVRWIPIFEIDDYEWTSKTHVEKMKEYWKMYEEEFCEY